MQPKKIYIGDAVYLTYDRDFGRFTLTTEDGYWRATNTIVLEPEVMATLFEVIGHCIDKQIQITEASD